MQISYYFINAAQNLLKNLGKSNNEFQDYSKNPNKHSFFLKEVDPEEEHKLLLELNTKKSSDIFGISPELIKLSTEFIKGHLSLIFNESFKEGIFISIKMNKHFQKQNYNDDKTKNEKYN